MGVSNWSPDCDLAKYITIKFYIGSRDQSRDWIEMAEKNISILKSISGGNVIE